MGLIEKLYPEDESYLEPIWHKFLFFHPKVPYLGFKVVSRAVREEDKTFLINQVRNSFFPDLGDGDIEKEFGRAMNRGIKAVNKLCNEHLEGMNYDFGIEEVSELDLFKLIKSAREDWIEARNGRHVPDPELLFKAYDRVRNFGLGYRVLMIDQSPEVISSFKQHPLVLSWFNDRFEFENPQKVDDKEFSHKWQTKAGVEVYGSEENPINSRLKNLNSEGGLQYGSILMKMFLKGRFPDEIRDYTGVEFIVEDEKAVSELVFYFGNEIRAKGKLESFKSRKKGGKRRDNEYSNSDFGVTKFIVRPPVPVDYLPGHPLGSRIYERVPVEVQILTLEDDRIRRENPDVSHEAYKEKQFKAVFPAWFPRQIYEPFIVT